MSEPAQDPTPEAPEREEEREGTAFVQVTRRRAPRFRSFALTGLLLAFVVSGAIAITTPPSDGYSQQALFGYLFCSLGLVLVLLGASSRSSPTGAPGPGRNPVGGAASAPGCDTLDAWPAVTDV